VGVLVLGWEVAGGQVQRGSNLRQLRDPRDSLLLKLEAIAARTSSRWRTSFIAIAIAKSSVSGSWILCRSNKVQYDL